MGEPALLIASGPHRTHPSPRSTPSSQFRIFILPGNTVIPEDAFDDEDTTSESTGKSCSAGKLHKYALEQVLWFVDRAVARAWSNGCKTGLYNCYREVPQACTMLADRHPT